VVCIGDPNLRVRDDVFGPMFCKDVHAFDMRDEPDFDFARRSVLRPIVVRLSNCAEMDGLASVGSCDSNGGAVSEGWPRFSVPCRLRPVLSLLSLMSSAE
jgi:hypothetical protein